MKPIKLIFVAFALVLVTATGCQPVAHVAAKNPIIWADVPDVSVIRVDDTYYMSSTTMHMNPGVPIMRSKDLVNWTLVDYAYDRLVDNDAMNLKNGENAYGRGSWASSLRYHNNQFYVSTFSATSGKTHTYTTKQVGSGNWQEVNFSPDFHDLSLYFENGRSFMVYGGGDIRLVELNDDLSGPKPGGINQVIIKNASAVAGSNIMLPAEGSQLRKINGYYYLLTITWPQDGMRTVLVHRAESLTGPYSGKVALQDQGIAQGSLIDTPDGDWYALLFGDRGAVGRIPYLVPVHWQDNWPVFGVDGKVPQRLDVAVANHNVAGIVTSDEFATDTLSLPWQWNHNPDNKHWSLTEREGFLRLGNGRIDKTLLDTRNTLTQRTFGPESTASVRIDISHLQQGDVAGLALIQKHYGYIGVKRSDTGTEIVAVQTANEQPTTLATLPLQQQDIYFKARAEFRDKTDEAQFYYSLNGSDWLPLGPVLNMQYTLPHFMGYRFGLFHFATQQLGGFADFDYYRLAPFAEIDGAPAL